MADVGISPTEWKASTFPEPFRSRITVVHDGIDTQALVPNPQVSLRLAAQGGGAPGSTPGVRTLTRQDQVLTFVNRNLEPYRGNHIFMRALPQILREHPQLRVMVVGGLGCQLWRQAPGRYHLAPAVHRRSVYSH